MVEPPTPEPTPTPAPPKSEKIEPEQIFNYLGFEGIKTFSDFQDKVGQEYVRRNPEVIRGDDKLFNQLMGAKTKGTITALQRALKANGVPFTDEDFIDNSGPKPKDIKLENVVESWATRLAQMNVDKVKDLEAKLTTGADEQVKKIQADLDALNAKYTEATGKLATIEQEWTGKLTEKEKEISSLALNTQKEKAWGGFKWAAGAKELEKEGFQAKMEKTFDFVFDENKKLVPMQGGKRIPNPAVKDSFYETDELLKAEGIKAGVYAISPHNGQTPKKQEIKTENPNGNANPNGLKINPLRPQIRVQG